MEILQEKKANIFIDIIRNSFISIIQIIYHFNPNDAQQFKQRNAYFMKKKQDCCHQDINIYIPQENQTFLEKNIQEITSKQWLKSNMPALVEFLALKYNNIKKSGLSGGLEINRETENYLLTETLKNGIQKWIIDNLKQRLQQNYQIDSKQPMLFASPQTWFQMHPEIELNQIQNDTLMQFYNDDYSIQNFVNNDFNEMLFKEFSYLELNQKFECIQQSDREDNILWIFLKDISQDQFKSIYFISQMLSSLPYELNMKTKFLCQISEQFQISYFKPNSYQNNFMDNDFQNENGRKISSLYFCCQEDNCGNLELTLKNGKIIDIKIKRDLFVFFKSRIVKYKINVNQNKVFIIRYWINGPAQDQQI